MPELISRVAHIYAGRQLAAGERFHADAEFATVLIGLGRADLAPLQCQAETSQTQDMVVADPVVYPTRDMTAAVPAAYPTRDIALSARQKRKQARRQLV